VYIEKLPREEQEKILAAERCFSLEPDPTPIPFNRLDLPVIREIRQKVYDTGEHLKQNIWNAKSS
jgi:hypothetical protein